MPIGGEWFAPTHDLERINAMTTRKNTSAPVRFSAGAAEILAADALRDATQAEATTFKAFYETVVKAHDVPLAAFEPKKAGETRSNEYQAAYDFGRRMFWIATFGVAIADKIADANVKGDTVLPLSDVIGRDGLPYKDQEKRKVQQSFGGSKGWGVFVSRLKLIENAGGADAKRGAGVKSSDAGYIKERVNAILGRMARDAEKFDGSVSVDIAPKFSKALMDTCAMYGINLK